jgi:hypothetical protein
MPFVFAFVAFNLLDLDGSNFATLTQWFEHVSIVGVVGTEPPVDPRPERVELLASDSATTPSRFQDIPQAQFLRLLGFPSLGMARAHHYRVGLPRDDVPG